MTRYLLDVNVLLALVWPRLESHAAAHEWFARSGSRAWATNILTQLGVLRLLSNPAVTQGAVAATRARDLLREMTRHPGHEFWAYDRDWAAGLDFMAQRIQGHRQWTDALLVWHAMKMDGVLVTFDSGLKEMATPPLRSHLLVLKVS